MKIKSKNTKKNKVGNGLMNNSTNLQLMNKYQFDLICHLIDYYRRIIKKKGVEKVNKEVQLKMFELEELPSCECCDDPVYPIDMMFNRFIDVHRNLENNTLTKGDTEFLSEFK
jgi:hypothetical protein